MSPSEQELVVNNMPFVYHLINKHYPSYSQDEDVIQVGMVGLCKAAQRWKPEKSKFTTFAGSVILNEIKMYFRQMMNKGKDDTQILSLDATFENDEDTFTLADMIGECDDWDSAMDDFTTFKSGLHCRDQQLCDLLMSGTTQVECAKRMGLCKQTVCKLVRQIKRKWVEFYADQD